MEIKSEEQNSFAVEEVTCVFCDRLLDDHSTDQLKQCMAKHLLNLTNHLTHIAKYLYAYGK